MTPSQLGVMLLESGIASADASDLVTLLVPLAGPVEAPTPSADLRALFGQDASSWTGAARPSRTGSQRRRGRARSAVAGVVVLAVSGVGATGLSAAANTLPSSWQRQVSDFSRQHLPFVFPEPRERSPQGRRAPGAGPENTRAGRHRHGDAVRDYADLTQGSRSLDGDRDASSEQASGSDRSRAHRLGTASSTAQPGPRAASPSAAPTHVVELAQAPQNVPALRDFTGGDGGAEMGENSGKGSDSPSKSRSKAPWKTPSDTPVKAPGKGADKDQKPDDGHDPVVGPQAAQNVPRNGPENGPQNVPPNVPQSGPKNGLQNGPGGDQGQTPGDGSAGGVGPGGDQGVGPGGDQGGVAAEEPPREQALDPGPASEQDFDDGAG